MTKYQIKSYQRCGRTGSSVRTRYVVEGKRLLRQDVTLSAPDVEPKPLFETVEYGDYTKREYER